MPRINRFEELDVGYLTQETVEALSNLTRELGRMPAGLMRDIRNANYTATTYTTRISVDHQPDQQSSAPDAGLET